MRSGTRIVAPVLAGLFVVVAAMPLGSPPPVTAASADLFLSEYIEGTSNNKALEIYNGTGVAVNLNAGGYGLFYHFNGNPSAGLAIPLTGTVANGDVYVVAQSTASPAILAQADQTDPSGWFNGDDAVVLRKGGAGGPILDVIGQVGFDPGTEWGSGLTSTMDNTLRRKAAIEAGDTNGGNAFDPSAEWDGFATDTFGGLGSHTVTPGINLTISDVSASEGNSGATSFDFTVNLSSASGPSGVTFDIATADGSATTANNDYVGKALTGQTIASGSSTYSFSVLVNGDTSEEVDETFLVNVTNVTGATVADGQGQGTVLNDDTNFCAQPFTPIYQIQGSGSSAAITGPVTTQGVLVGDFEGPTSAGLQGFYIQDVAGDDDATTSDGLFVFTGNTDNGLVVGDVVRVSGNAGEFNNQTQVSASALVECGTGDPPAIVDITLPVATTNELERYEGMRARFPQALVISEYFQFEQFGEMVLALPLPGEDRAFTPTHLEEPGSPEYFARLSANQRSRITLNDGLANSNPPSVRHPNGTPFSLTNRFRGGDTVQNAVGILGQRLAAYRIEPTGPASYTTVNPRQPAPDPVGGSIQVAAMNMLNYFLTADFPTGNPNDNKCGPLQNVECRGHDSDQPTELSRQRVKLIAALSGLGAEVIGLNELENTPGVDPVGDLVAGLNALEGSGTYAYIDTGVIGTDAIRVGLVYKPGAVTPVGSYEILDSSDDPRFIDTLNRPVLAQTFSVNATGAVFTIAVNHLKSKNASPACLPDSGDGQGSCSEVREAAAQALVDWLASDPTGSNDPDFLIAGDLNSYAMEDPIDSARAGSDDTLGTGDDYTNLIAQYMGDHAYSFVFDGMSGYLDHALATSSLTAQVTGATEWHINSDEPDILDYDTSFKPTTQDALYEPNAFRSSDHDPVIVGLNLTPNAGKVTGSGTWADGLFDVSAQFHKNATSPTGSTTLGLPGGDSFVSTGYDWLSVAGSEATWLGTGTLNGEAGYGFWVSVRDGGSPVADEIRVKVWAADGDVVYDSQPGDPVSATPTAALTSGNITIHKLK